jgi:NAD-dependent dihydropyrimidine dehydrogenase PreA subunit
MTLTYLGNGGTLTLDPASCGGCGACIDVCPHDVFRIEDDVALIAARGRCMECGACAFNCPTGALGVRSGVGCAAAVLNGLLRKTEPACGCSTSAGSCCGGGNAKSEGSSCCG